VFNRLQMWGYRRGQGVIHSDGEGGLVSGGGRREVKGGPLFVAAALIHRRYESREKILGGKSGL